MKTRRLHKESQLHGLLQLRTLILLQCVSEVKSRLKSANLIVGSLSPPTVEGHVFVATWRTCRAGGSGQI